MMAYLMGEDLDRPSSKDSLFSFDMDVWFSFLTSSPAAASANLTALMAAITVTAVTLFSINL